MHIKIVRLALIAGGGLLAGCQAYEPRPLDLAEHRAAWLERSAASERVIEFARRLEEADVTPDRFDPADGITGPEAEVIALVFNPDLRLARAGSGVTAATAEHAGVWEDPVFEIDVLRITESVPDRWIVSAGLGFTIPLSGRLAAERDRAGAALRAELAAVAEKEWSVRLAVRAAWLEWSAARLRHAETTSLATRLESLTRSADRLADAGELPRPEATLFAIELAQRRNETIGLDRTVVETRGLLRMLLGLSPAAPFELVPSSALAAERPPSGRDVKGNRDLRRLRAEYDVAEQTLRREIRKQYPDLTVGPLYESDEGQSRIGFLGAIPVPLINANREAIAAARAERELARVAFETEYERLASRLAQAAERAASLHRQRADVETTLIPLVDRQLADARRLLEIGEGSGLVILESLVRAHQTKLTLIDLRRDEALAAIEITHLIGPDDDHAASPTRTEGTP